MNRFRSRTVAVTSGLAACGVAAAVALTGCGTGQISQTANQEPAVNGSRTQAGPVVLRNIHLRAPQKTDFVQPGSDVELLFVAVNNSPDTNDKLVGVRSDVGTVTLTGNGAVPAGGVLVVGTPDGQTKALQNVETADTATAKVALHKPISNGLTYAFTFDFEKAGPTTVQVPISAGEAPRRDSAGEAGAASEAGAHSEGGEH